MDQFPAKCAGESTPPPPSTPKRKDSVATVELATKDSEEEETTLDGKATSRWS